MEPHHLILDTSRLTLIPFTLMDHQLLHETFIDPYVRKYLWDDDIISSDQALDILKVNETHFKDQGWGLWKIVIKPDHSFAGFAGLWMFFDEGQPQLLYGLLPGYIGQGFATEASRAVCRYALEVLQFRELTASFDTINTSSQGVCERLGMTHLKTEIMNGKETSFYRLIP